MPIEMATDSRFSVETIGDATRQCEDWVQLEIMGYHKGAAAY